MSRIVRPSSVRMPPEQRGHLGRLHRVHAGRRLVEQEQLGLAGEGARDLQPALVAVGQVASRLVLEALEPHEGEPPSGLRLGFLLLAPVARQPQGGVEGRRVEPRVHADHHVLERGHGLKEPDVLERSAQAGDDHVVGAGALEDPQPVEHALVDRRPDDREQEHRDQEPQRDQEGQRDHEVGPGDRPRQDAQDRDDHGGAEPR